MRRMVPCSPIVYAMVPNVIPNDFYIGYLPLFTVKVFSKATNKQLRAFRIPWCSYSAAQPVMVP